MLINNSSSGWGDRLLAGALTILLIVAGVFASLFALALVGATGLVAGVKLWWIRRQRSKLIIDAEYRVLPE